MEMTGETVIPAPRAAVWAALNDIEVLKAAIPGCETMTRLSQDQIEATVLAKVGPVKASFKGIVTLSDLDPPNGYKIRGEGKGGAAGFARGGATVTLADAAGGTRLSYAVDAAVGGKLAQIGSRLIDSTAKKLADEFFAAFSARVSGQAPAATAPAAAEAPPVLPASTVAAAAKTGELASHDALADFKPIRFGTWVIMLIVLAVAIGVVVTIW